MKHLQTFENYSVNEEQLSAITKGASLLGKKLAYKVGRVASALKKDFDNLLSGKVYMDKKGGYTSTKNLRRELSEGLPETFTMTSMLREQLNQRISEISKMLIKFDPSGLEKEASKKLGNQTPSEWWMSATMRLPDVEIEKLNNLMRTTTGEIKITDMKGIKGNMGVDEYGPYLLVTMEGFDTIGKIELSNIKSLLQMIGEGDAGLDVINKFSKYKLFGTNKSLGDLGKSIRNVRYSGKTDVPGYKPGTGTGKYYTPGIDKYGK